jgi:type I restriction enzyme S subunit
MQYKLLVKKVSIPPDKKTKQKEYLSTGKLPIVDQGKPLIGGYSDDISKQISCNLPVIVFGDHTKNVKFISFPFGAGADGIKVLEPKSDILAKYLYYGTLYLTFKIEDKGYARHYQHIEKQDLPVPPLPEQERIVARIEELFSELDKAVETLKKTKVQLAVYRQAVLTNAFEKIHKVVELDNLAVMIDPHPSHRTPPEVADGVPYIGIGDICYEEQRICFEDARKVAIGVLAEHKNRYKLHLGDFVMGKIGTIGKQFRLPLPQNYALSANVILIQPNSDIIIPDFLFWQFSSPLITQQLTLGAKATSQPAFGIKKARKLQIRICNIDKQKTILIDIEEKMSVCNNIEKTIDTALQEAEALRQSILKDAFEGKLIQ